MIRAAVAVLLAVATGVPAQQASTESLDSLLQQVLQLDISLRVVDPQIEETVWTAEVERVTVSGRTVSVRLEGVNVVIEAEFTPYWDEAEQLLLVAHGRTWTRFSESAEPTYHSSFTTLPINLGEPIVFLPLGVSQVPVETDRHGRLDIELELNIGRMRS